MHSINMSVRDYECDLQGIVNNSTYFNYFEHARHTFFKDHHFTFQSLLDRGINAVVFAAQVKYLMPLKPDDKFFITTSVKREGKLKIIFEQVLFVAVNNKRCCEGIFEVVLLDENMKLIKNTTQIDEFFEMLHQ